MKEIYQHFLNHLNSKTFLIQVIPLAQKNIKFVSDSLILQYPTQWLIREGVPSGPQPLQKSLFLII